MVNLDDGRLYEELDPQGMGARIEDFPAQVEEAWRIGLTARVPSDYAEVDQIVVQGMGGSAVGGDLLGALYAAKLKVPYLVVRDYALPGFAWPRTLFIASSYSGNTEETLSGYEQAKERGCKILAATSGGKLAAWAGRAGFPHIAIPAGYMPRAALGYSFFPLLAALGRLGLLPDASFEVEETVAVLKEGVGRLGRRVPTAENPAKEIARWFYGAYPLVYAAGSWPGVVAMRWKTQINENAKNLAFWNVLPELNHNETVGYEAPAELIGKIRVLFLLTGEEGPRQAKRIEVTRGIVDRAGAETRTLAATGRSPLARMMSLIQYGDFVSLYLAMLNGVDPTPVKVIDLLKGELAKLDG
ncbi:MAG: bifunctional phosphoglucose/phosphomannose isomerase [Firmicutes bacterium]|nr:bifunctional phosphoglucose/phosphomannose isomerase [Bacillota bacterium]